jgi:hypothetical protein
VIYIVKSVILAVNASLRWLKKLKKWPRPLFRPRTNHSCHENPHSSRETVPLSLALVVTVR